MATVYFNNKVTGFSIYFVAEKSNFSIVLGRKKNQLSTYMQGVSEDELVVRSTWKVRNSRGVHKNLF
jgi:hypothetical protein